MTRDAPCAAYRAALLDALADGRPRPSADEAHPLSCAACRAAAEEVIAAWGALGALPPTAPAPALRARTRGAVLAAMSAERTAAARARRRRALQAPLAVVSGVLVATATLLLLGGIVWGGSMPRGHVFFCGAILAGLLVGVFSWIYGATVVDGVQLGTAARVGVLGLAVTMAATTACPELHVLTWWDHSAAGRFFTARLGPGGSSLVFGVGYGLLPGFVAALFGGRLLRERPVANGAVAAAVAFLLATPVIYLQSEPFASGVLASWLAGTALGTSCGVFGALRLHRRLRLAEG